MKKWLKLALLSVAVMISMEFILSFDAYAGWKVNVYEKLGDAIAKSPCGYIEIEAPTGGSSGTAFYYDEKGNKTNIISDGMSREVEGYEFMGGKDEKGSLSYINSSGFAVATIYNTMAGDSIHLIYKPKVYRIMLNMNDGSGMTKTWSVYEKCGVGFYSKAECSSADKYVFSSHVWGGSGGPNAKKFKGYMNGTELFIDEKGNIVQKPDYFKDNVTLDAVWENAVVEVQLDKVGGTSTKDNIYVKFDTGVYTESGCDATSIISSLSTDYIPTKSGYDFQGYYIGTTKYIDASGIFVKSIKDEEDIFTGAKLTANWKEKETVITVKNESTNTTIDIFTQADNSIYVLRGLVSETIASKTNKKMKMELFKAQEHKKFTGLYDGSGTQYVNDNWEIVNDAMFSYAGQLFAKWTGKVYPVNLYENKYDGDIKGCGQVYLKYEDGIYKKYDTKNDVVSEKITVLSTPSSTDRLVFNGYYSNKSSSSYGQYADKSGKIIGSLATAKVAPAPSGDTISLYAQWIETPTVLDLMRSDGIGVGSRMYLLGDSKVHRGANRDDDEDRLYKVDPPKATNSNIEFLGYYADRGYFLDGVDAVADSPIKLSLLGAGASSTSGSIKVIDSDGSILNTALYLRTGSVPLLSKWAPKASPTPPTPSTNPTNSDNSSHNSNNNGSPSGSGGGSVSGNQLLYGWRKVADKWYYYLNSTTVHKGWLYENGKGFYYLDADDEGAMATGYRVVDRNLYYYKEDGNEMGLMLHDENINDVYVGNSGSIAEVVSCVKAKSSAFDNIVNKYYLIDSEDKVVSGEVASFKGPIYATSPYKYRSGTSELLCGYCALDNIMLYFDPATGGSLNDIYIYNRAQNMQYVIKGKSNVIEKKVIVQ